MGSLLDHIIGPRVEPELFRSKSIRFGTPGFLLLVARILLLISMFVPFWHMELIAPQYPDNLHLTAYVDHLAGDVAEIDSLNHYIGMRPLEEAAQVERSIGVYILIAFVIMLELASWVHTRWAVLLVVGAILFPAVFLVDLYLWMSHFGQNLDPDAPLSNAVDPFVPPILGTGNVGQFQTVASPGIGLILATIASVILIAALYFHRRAYKPLVQQRQAES